MNGRGRAAGKRLTCARVLLLFTLVVTGAAIIVGCGGSSSDIGPYLGLWQRVEAGAPDPDFTLTVAARDGGAAVTFANLANGVRQTVVATVEDGHLACSLPTGDDPQVQASESPAESDLQLSVDENGQLVVDLVLADDTLEPIWIYDRAPASRAAEP